MDKEHTLFDVQLEDESAGAGGANGDGKAPPSEAREDVGALVPRAQIRTVGTIKEVTLSPSGKRFRAIANSGQTDRDGESIDPMGWKVSTETIPLLYGHNYGTQGQLPVGVIDKVRRSRTDGLVIDAEMADAVDHPHPLALWASSLIPKFLNRLSVGFIPLEWTNADGSEGKTGQAWGPSPGRRYTKQELLEVSLVPVPSDPGAMVLGFKSLTDGAGKSLAYLFEDSEPIKGAIPYRREPMDSSASWDGNREMGECSGRADYRAICAWVDGEGDPEQRQSYKLPHHRADGYQLVRGGLTAAMGALLGARGGVDIPQSDRQGVYNHLAHHYRDNDMQPPDLSRSYTPLELSLIAAFGVLPWSPGHKSA